MSPRTIRRIQVPPENAKGYSKQFSNEQRATLRRFCQQNLYFLTKEVLGYQKLYDPVHRPVCQFIASLKQPSDQSQTSNFQTRRLLLMPREFFKTTIVTIADTIQRIVQCLPEESPAKKPAYPMSQLLVTSTFGNVVRWTAKVKEQLTMNSELLSIFPELEPDTDWWRKDSLKLKGKPLPGLTSGNVDGVGVGGEITGRHYGIVKMDDIVNRKNSRSPEAREEVISWYASMQPILGQGLEFLVGTRYHYGDLYAGLLENPEYEKLVMSWHDEKGESLLPEIYSTEYFLKKRASMGSYLFATQYENEPTPADDATFKETWLNLYTSIPQGTKLYIAMLIDPSPGLPQGDPAGIVIVGEDVVSGDWYILHTEARRYPIEELTMRIFTLWKQFRPHETMIEYNGVQATFKLYMERRRKEMRMPIRIRYAAAESMDGKIARISQLVGKFEFGHVFLRPADTELRQQLRYWPNWKHDDLLDALAFFPFVKRYLMIDSYQPDVVHPELTPKQIVEEGMREFSGWV